MDCAEDFNATSDCQSLDKALRKNHEIWSENQYPTEWSSTIVNETLDKIITREKVTAKPPKMNNISKKVKVLTIMSLNRGFLYNKEEILIKFVSRLKNLYDNQTIFTTRKLRTCLPTLKSSFDKNLKSHVVYKVTCKVCGSIYVGQTSRHVTTRSSEHQKEDFPVVQRILLIGRFLIHVVGLKN